MKPPELSGGLGCGEELGLPQLEFPIEAWAFTWWFKYISMLDEVMTAIFLLFNLPLKKQVIYSMKLMQIYKW